MARRLTATTPEAPAFDRSLGSVDYWPILALPDADLCAEVARGDHDGYLSGLAHVARSQGGRPTLEAAIRARVSG